jgi:nucleoside-diphosphate-sugar epimerase
VNLIHVDDLATVIAAALERAERAEQFIVTDGTPRLWKDIACWAAKKGFVTGQLSGGTTRATSRRLQNTKMIRSLSPGLKHADLFAELEILEKVHPMS